MKNIENKTNFHPTGTNLLLIAIPEADSTPGGLIIPDKYKHSLNMGVVLEIGPDCTACEHDGKNTRFCGFREGDTVVFAMHTEHKIQFDRKDIYYVIDQSNVVLNDFGFTQSQPKLDNAEKSIDQRKEPLAFNRQPCPTCHMLMCICQGKTIEGVPLRK